jgi:predicted RNA methylase
MNTNSVPISVEIDPRLQSAIETFHTNLNQSTVLEPRHISQTMDECFGSGGWEWRDAYDCCEAAAWLLVRHWYKPMLDQSGNNTEMLDMLRKVEAMLPSQTWRSEEQENLQQFSTPLTLAWIAGLAAAIPEDTILLEPSAGTGALALQADIIPNIDLQLNEISERRAQILNYVFEIDVTTDHASYIHAKQSGKAKPQTLLMNPPFSADVKKPNSRSSSETIKHFHSAFYRLDEGGRCVIITGGTMTTSRLIDGLDLAMPRLSVIITSRAFQKQGTSIDTRIHVIDKIKGDAAITSQSVGSLEELLEIVETELTPRDHQTSTPQSEIQDNNPQVAVSGDLFGEDSHKADQISTADNVHVSKLQYEANPEPVSSSIGTEIFQPWSPGAIRIPGASAHPSTLAEAVAMAAIRPPLPSWQPHLPEALVRDNILSEAQLETVIHAGDAHTIILPQRFTFVEDTSADIIAKTDEDDGFKLRQGYFLGDGTGAGKGRQVAAIILDNWNQGRRKALWLSKSDKLVEDSKRDWKAVGGRDSDILPLSKFKQNQEIHALRGILFATYSTLRSAGRNGNPSRLDQIIAWLGEDFEGCLIFDEAHALGNAAGGEKSLRGKKAPSQQGIAGLAIQNRLPNARVVYVSATGASSVNALAYANRLGLWSQPNFPFDDRISFVTQMDEGGVAAAEIVARDLKALGLYTARNLSYEGVEVDILNTPLNEKQSEIYDQWAGAFQVIHKNLQAALQSTGIIDVEGVTRNKNAKSVARSRFESAKQRFFGHLLAGMKCPDLFKAIDANIENGQSVIIQIVSTGEAIMDRCLDRIHSSEWKDLNVDVTPRDTVLDYLNNAFPVQMQSEFEDEDGNVRAEPMVDDDGNPIFDPVALAARERMVEQLITLPPIPSALDQIVWHYGTDRIAEITGRSRRIVKHPDGRMAVESRSASSGLTEAQAFMDDEKQILIFSEAGGTGRSYHADQTAKNSRRRVHYLLEAGWRADNAIQGLGRSNRTGQTVPPIFRPVSTDVKGEKRFIATIARRLDTLGAITRGQRASASQGLFKEEDNLESSYAKSALSQFYRDLYHGRIEVINIDEFQDITGLELTYEGQLKESLPPMHTFLNRLLALPIDTQNALFAELEARISSRIEIAKQNGTYELGMETIKADHLNMQETEEIEGGLKICTIEAKYRLTPRTMDELRQITTTAISPRWCKNGQSNKYALMTKTSSLFNDDGSITDRVQLIRPDRTERISDNDYANSNWFEINEAEFTKGWDEECKNIPEFRTSILKLVTGTMLPVWDKLPSEAPKVRRLTTDSGDVLLGRLLDENQLNSFRKSMGLDTIQPDAEVLYDQLIEGGEPISLSNNLRLVPRRVYGVPKIEVVGDVLDVQDKLKDTHCTVEKHNYQIRVFVPNIVAMEAIIKLWPVE